MAVTSDQRALDLDLPDHHGRKPTGMRSKLRGASNRLGRTHEIGERVVLIVEARIEDAGHKELKRDGLTYIESAAVLDMFEADPETARDLLVGIRQQYRQADDERNGRQPLFDAPRPVRLGWIDDHGRVLSDEDLAELQGVDVEPTDEELEAKEREALEQEAAEDAEAFAQVVAPSWLRKVADGDTEGYDQLKVGQVVEALRFVDELSVVFACQTHEAANKNRASVRKAIEARASELAE